MTGEPEGAPDWGSPSALLEAAVGALPRVGIHRWPPALWPAPPGFHPAGAEVAIAEEHGGFAFGGNKVRQVDVLLGTARAAGADTVVTAAGPQSNLCRVMAAGARAAGMEIHLVLRGHPPSEPRGNQLLYDLAGAARHWLEAADPFDPRQAEETARIAREIRAAGGTPAEIDVRGDRGGTLCAMAATGIVADLALTPGSAPHRIVLAASAGNTAGGVLAALAARGARVGLVAVAASGTTERLRALILQRARAVLERAGLPAGLVGTVRLEVDDGFVGGGHGVPTEEGAAAQRRTAERCGCYLDPTYTGKAMAALLADPRPGRALFLHTGGGPSLFAAPPPTLLPRAAP